MMTYRIKRILHLIDVLFLLTALGISTVHAALSDHFVTTWKTDNPGPSNDTSITVPILGGPYDVDWDNDGIFDEFWLTGPVTHDFGRAGTYTIRIQGIYDQIYFGGSSSRDKNKIVSLDQWGTQPWTSMKGAFFGCSNLEIRATDTPDLSAVTDMSYMFADAYVADPDTRGWDTSAVTNMSYMFYQAISANPDTRGWDTSAVTDMNNMFAHAKAANPDTSGWNTSAVTDMTSMFYNAISANPDTSGWNTSAVTKMRYMFQSATSANPDTSGWDTSSVRLMNFMFYGARLANPDTSGWNTSAVWSMESMFQNASSANPDTSGWNTSAVTNMRRMFAGAVSANPDTSGWNTSAVTNMHMMFAGTEANPDTSGWGTSAVRDMSYMFYQATSANPDTSGWDTSAVTNMSNMFYHAYAADPDTSGWNTSAVTDMSSMFRVATSANPDTSGWDVSSLTDATRIFFGVKLSESNYESLLINWNAQALQAGLTFDGGDSTYCSSAAANARANMINSDKWTITDAGQACEGPPDTCNVEWISSTIDNFGTTHEACEILVLGPDYIAADGSNISANSGWEIDFLPGFLVEQGATLKANTCGQSLCMTSPAPMPYGCHTCVDQICDIEPACCELAFDQACLDKVDTVCGLVCE